MHTFEQLIARRLFVPTHNATPVTLAISSVSRWSNSVLTSCKTTKKSCEHHSFWPLPSQQEAQPAHAGWCDIFGYKVIKLNCLVKSIRTKTSISQVSPPTTSNMINTFTDLFLRSAHPKQFKSYCDFWMSKHSILRYYTCSKPIFTDNYHAYI